MGLSIHTSQRLTGWVCALTFALSLAALAVRGSVFLPQSDAALGNITCSSLVTSLMQRESCFLAGTSVTLGTGGHQAIETLVIGQRVSTPESSQGGPLSPLSGSETQVDPTTWRSYTVRLQDARTGWDRFDITLLRPQGWMAEHSFAEYHGRQPPSHA